MYQYTWLGQESVFLRDWEDEQVTTREPRVSSEGPEGSHRSVCRRCLPLSFPSTGGVLVVLHVQIKIRTFKEDLKMI